MKRQKTTEKLVSLIGETLVLFLAVGAVTPLFLIYLLLRGCGA